MSETRAIICRQRQLDIGVLVEAEVDPTRFARLNDLAAQRIGDTRGERDGLPRVEADLERVVLGVHRALIRTRSRVERKKAARAADMNLVGDEPAAVGRHLVAGEAAVAELAGWGVAGIPIL